MKKLICILCPRGCHLNIDEENACKVTGNGCPRGADYGKEEITAPARTVTSTAKIINALYNRCPVKTDRKIPKQLVFDALRLLDDVQLHAPVRCGDIIAADIFNTGVNIVVTKDMDAMS